MQIAGTIPRAPRPSAREFLNLGDARMEAARACGVSPDGTLRSLIHDRPKTPRPPHPQRLSIHLLELQELLHPEPRVRPDEIDAQAVAGRSRRQSSPLVHVSRDRIHQAARSIERARL